MANMELFIITTKNEMYVTYGENEIEVKKRFLKDFPAEIPIRIINSEAESLKFEEGDMEK